MPDFFNDTGAGLNRTRLVSPCGGKKYSSDTEKIDLYNFENPKFENSKYVLSSPRSLEACRRMGVKPLELLYKSLADFQDEFAERGFPLSKVYELYDARDKERIETLRACREERLRVMRDEELQKQVTSAKNKKSLLMESNSVAEPTRGRSYENVTAPLQKERQQLLLELSRTKNLLFSEPIKPKSKCHVTFSEDRKSRELTRQKRKISRPLSADARTSQFRCSSENHFLEKERKLNRIYEAKVRGVVQGKKNEHRTRLKCDEVDPRVRSSSKNIAPRNRTQRSQSARRADGREKLEYTGFKPTSLSDNSDHVIGRGILRDHEQFTGKEKLRKELERKRKQEILLAEEERDREEINSIMRELSNLEQRLAARRREGIKESVKAEKFSQKLRHLCKRESRLNDIRLESDKEAEKKRKEVEEKYERTSQSMKQHRRRKDNQLKKNHDYNQWQREKVKSAQDKSKKNREKYLTDLSRYSTLKEDNAKEAAKLHAKRRQQKVNCCRTQHERAQREARQKIMREEQLARSETEQLLESKLARASSLQEERNRNAEKKREINHSGELMRQKLREKYGSDSFDKKALRAKLDARIVEGRSTVQTGLRNETTIDIGI